MNLGISQLPRQISKAALLKLTDWIIKNDHVVNYGLFFRDKHGEKSAFIRLFTSSLFFRLEVANKKPLFPRSDIT